MFVAYILGGFPMGSSLRNSVARLYDLYRPQFMSNSVSALAAQDG